MATKKCRYGRKKTGGCKKKPGPKKGTRGRRTKKRRCKHGVSKTTGRCLKRKRSK
jgi:hypothetical protein